MLVYEKKRGILLKVNNLVRREKFLLHYCRGKDILHLGCCGSPYCQERYVKGDLFHVKLMLSALSVIGVDNNIDDVAFLKNNGIDNVYVGDVEKLDNNILNKKYHIVLAGEILEHINNPGLFLKGIDRIISEDVEFLLTVPNTPTLKSFLRALWGREMVHRDHVCYYSYKTLKSLLNRFDYKIKDYYYYCVPPVHESGLMMKLFNKIAENFCKIFPSLGDGLIVICKRNDYPK